MNAIDVIALVLAALSATGSVGLLLFVLAYINKHF